MGLAPLGNLAEQHKISPFTNSEFVLILRQMLDALVFLHVGQNIIHRDIKMENILCDSREHFRLADFGIAGEGYYLGSRKGTKPWMAPEMVLGESYTSKVDVYGLGLVIALLLTGNLPRKYIYNEGLSWCDALISHFKSYKERIQKEAVDDQEQLWLTDLVSEHMLMMEPDDRESAPGCLKQGKFLWLFSDNRRWILKHSNDNSNSILEGNQDKSVSSRLPLNKTKERSKDIRLTEKHESLQQKELESEGEGVLEVDDMGDQDPAEDVDTEATTEVRTLNTADWESLEREHAAPLAAGGLNQSKKRKWSS